MPRKTLDILLPVFSIESDCSLQDALTSLGVSDLFSPAADLSVMTGGEKSAVFVNSIRQKAVVKVDEKGTIAAAVTSVDVVDGPCAPAVAFQADHPFLFFIIDESSDLILFAGRLARVD